MIRFQEKPERLPIDPKQHCLYLIDTPKDFEDNINCIKEHVNIFHRAFVSCVSEDLENRETDLDKYFKALELAFNKDIYIEKVGKLNFIIWDITDENSEGYLTPEDLLKLKKGDKVIAENFNCILDDKVHDINGEKIIIIEDVNEDRINGFVKLLLNSSKPEDIRYAKFTQEFDDRFRETLTTFNLKYWNGNVRFKNI